MLRKKLCLFPPTNSFSTPSYSPFNIGIRISWGLANNCSSFVRRTRERYICSLNHPRSGRILSSKVKLRIGSVSMPRHTTMWAEFLQKFIDDPLLDSCSIWHGEVDRTKQVCWQIHLYHDSGKGQPRHGESEVITSNRFTNNTVNLWQTCLLPTFQQEIWKTYPNWYKWHIWFTKIKIRRHRLYHQRLTLNKVRAFAQNFEHISFWREAEDQPAWIMKIRSDIAFP